MAIAPMVTRPFRPSDGAALATLHRRAILALTDEFYGRAERESWASGVTDGGYAAAVADEEIIQVALDGAGEAIAFCAHRDDQILALYVDPEWQRHGIGRFLLRRTEPMMAASGCEVIRVNSSLNATPFYQGCGYRFVGEGWYATVGGLTIATARLEKFIAL
jgi:GNAT superfamily N-acetyltransferase